MTNLSQNKPEGTHPVCYVCLEPGEHLKPFHARIMNGYRIEEQTLWYCDDDSWSCDGWNHEFLSLLRDYVRDGSGWASYEACMEAAHGLIKSMSKRCSSARLAYFKRLLAEVGLVVD